MSVESIVEKIRADGRAEAESILAAGQKRADDLIEEANAEAEKTRREAEADVKKRAESIAERYAAAARLDVKKIRLSAKRKAVQNAYAEAKARLLSLGEEDAMRLYSRLIETYAEEGDALLFADGFRYVDRVALLPVFREKKLTIVKPNEKKGVRIDGGVYFVGKIADKDLSFDALLQADFEERQAEVAVALLGEKESL